MSVRVVGPLRAELVTLFEFTMRENWNTKVPAFEIDQYLLLNKRQGIEGNVALNAAFKLHMSPSND